MQTYDVIIIGNGLAGAALSYELAKLGHSVLLMDNGSPDSGTRYSYGGIGYWAGTTELTETLFRAGIVRHRELPDELGADTQLRELDLLLTIAKGQALTAVKESYTAMRTPPQFVDAKTAHEIEPLLNPAAVEGAFTTRHAHVDPLSLVTGYNQAFRQLGGHHQLSAVTGLVRIKDRVTGVTTGVQAYAAKQVIVSAGAYSLLLLRAVGVQVPLYYTHAEIIETAPLDFEVRSLIMPATNARTASESAPLDPSEWQEPDRQVMPPVLEAGVIQFQDRTARIGQISRFHTAFGPPVEANKSEQSIRDAIAEPLPRLQNVPGTWRHCLVTFTQDNLPLLGPVPAIEGLHLFSGFTGPFVLVPPVAQRYAQHLSHAPDELIEQMMVSRFS